MTDKVNAEVPSSFTGKITELVASEGDTIEVGELMCYIETEGGGEEASSDDAGEDKPEAPVEKEAVGDADDQADEDQPMKKRYSPAVLRMAQDTISTSSCKRTTCTFWTTTYSARRRRRNPSNRRA